MVCSVETGAVRPWCKEHRATLRAVGRAAAPGSRGPAQLAAGIIAHRKGLSVSDLRKRATRALLADLAELG
ncbi:MAG: hypothetical protein ACXV3F_15025 [Frankiaceae bacterium]